MLHKVQTLTCLMVCLVGAIAFADVPDLVSYQGRVTDSEGTPLDGTYMIQFTVYDGPATTATPLWTSGGLMLPVSNGFVAHNLGDSVHLPDDLFAENPNRWLGVQVGADPELYPRTRLTSASYAYHALRADTATVLTSFPPNSIFSEQIGDASIRRADIYQDGATDGQVMKWRSGADSWMAEDDLTGGSNITEIQAGSALSGGGDSGVVTLAVAEGGVNAWHVQDNSLDGKEIAENAISASELAANAVTSTHIAYGTIEASDLGTGSVGTDELQNDCVDSTKLAPNSVTEASVANSSLRDYDILDEAGLAYNYNGTSVSLTTAGMVDLATVTLDAPTSGYVLVTARCNVSLLNTTGINASLVQLDTAAGGTWLSPNYLIVEAQGFPVSGSYIYPVSINRVFYVSASGETTYRLEGCRYGGLTGTSIASFSYITAVFYPTIYNKVKESSPPALLESGPAWLPDGTVAPPPGSSLYSKQE